MRQAYKIPEELYFEIKSSLKFESENKRSKD